MYNLTVIALTLAYQAPLHELTFGKWTAADKVRAGPSIVYLMASKVVTPCYAAAFQPLAQTWRAFHQPLAMTHSSRLSATQRHKVHLLLSRRG